MNFKLKNVALAAAMLAAGVVYAAFSDNMSANDVATEIATRLEREGPGSLQTVATDALKAGVSAEVLTAQMLAIAPNIDVGQVMSTIVYASKNAGLSVSESTVANAVAKVAASQNISADIIVSSIQSAAPSVSTASIQSAMISGNSGYINVIGSTAAGIPAPTSTPTNTEVVVAPPPAPTPATFTNTAGSTLGGVTSPGGGGTASPS